MANNDYVCCSVYAGKFKCLVLSGTFLYFYYSYSKSYLFTIKHKIYQAQKRKKDLLYVMTEPLKAPINVSVKVPGDKV